MCSINHVKKAIFIHNPKVAGIYIRSTLSSYYDFELFLLQRDDHYEYCDTDQKKNDYNKYIEPYFANNNKGVYNYYSTSKYLCNLMMMDNDKWNNYKKIIFIRNPYERIVSAWNYIMEVHKLNIDFDKYIFLEDIVSEDEYFHVFMPQFKNMIDENGKMIIDYIGNFENLEEDLKKILIQIGFNENEIIHKKTNKMNQRLKKNYKIFYSSQKILDKVNQLYELDFKNLKFKKVNTLEELNLL